MHDFIFNTFTWTVIGFVVAYITHIFSDTPGKYSLGQTILFSLFGAFSGGILTNVILGQQVISGFNIVGLGLGIVGIVLIAILHQLMVNYSRFYRRVM